MGSRFDEVWEHPSPLVHRAIAGHGQLSENLMLPNGDDHGGRAVYTFSYSPVRDETGPTQGVFCVCTEMTGQAKARAALEAEKEQLEDLFRHAPGFMAVLRGPDHVFELANTAFLQFFGFRDLIGKAAREAVPEVEGQGFFELLDEVYASGAPFIGHELPMRRQMQPGQPTEEAFIDFVYQPIRNADGLVVGIFVEGRDVIDRVRAAEHQQLLINELTHRVKNTLTTVQSIVSQTLRSSGSQEEARVFIERRLIALSRAHDLLTGENWQDASLHEIVAQTAEPFRSHRDRIHARGPEIRLSPRMALDLAMVLHELVTNAVKHGALSNATGETDLTWSVDRRSEPPRLTMRWEERGGPSVQVPMRRGFGTRLIERGFAHGEVRIAFAPNGIVCGIDAPIT